MMAVTLKLHAPRAVLLVLVSLVLVGCRGAEDRISLITNQLPTVNAGSDQQVDESTAVTLVGSAADVDGRIASLRWQQISGPTVTLSGATTTSLRFDAPAVNANTELRFSLSATDNVGAVSIDEVLVTVRDAPTSNRVPVVNAGLDQSVDEGVVVTLTGAASDEDGSIEGYQWLQTAGPAVTLTGAGTASLSFTAPAVTAATVLSFSLTATDNAGGSASDTVNVAVQDQPAANRLPVADAGPDQNVDEGGNVSLLGSGRDDDGSIASYQWTQVSGPAVTLSDAAIARPGFTAPQVSADTTLVFELVVTDNQGARSPADRSSVVVRNVVTANQPPVADAGSDQSVDEGVAVTLSGSGSDPDGSVQGFAWTQTAGPAVSLSGANTATPGFTAPQVDALTTLSFSLTVSDNRGDTASDTVDVRVQNIAGSNRLPLADAGSDQTVDEGAAVSLPGIASDPDGSVASVAWTQVAGAAVTLTGANTSTVRFTAPQVSGNGSLVFRFTATDNQGATASDEVAVLVRDTTATAALCAPGSFCVGSAKRSISPSDAHIAGITEDRLAGQTSQQTFHLGGFGLGPLEALGPINDSISNPPAARAIHCKGLKASCEEAERERTWVRAIYLGQPDAGSAGSRVLFVTIDAVGAGNLIQRDVTAAISAETGVPVENILFGQTHSHAGADLQGLWGGVPQDWVQRTLISQAVAASKEAQLNARASEMTYAVGRDSAFNNYRRPRQTDPLADSDDRLSVLQARDSLGAVLATLVQYTAHPTAIGTGSGGALGRVPHPDYPLGLEDRLESTFGATAVYYNGAIADASGSGPTTGSDDYARVRSRGDCLAKSVLTVLNPAAPQQCSFSLLKPAEVSKVQLTPTLAVRHATAVLPVTNPVFVAAAAAGAFNRYYDFAMLPLASIPGIGPQLAAQQTNLPQVAPTATTLVTRITIGGVDNGLEIVTIPGEATNTFGQSIRRLAKTPNMMLMGLTHNSFGYIIPEEEFSYIDASGEAGFVAPFTGYEEFVSMGPLTAPLLRLQAYNPLFDVTTADARNLPPSLLACMSDPAARDCIVSQMLYRLDYVQHAYAQTCRDNLAANAPAELKEAANAFCDLLDPETPLAQPCRDAGGPEGLCAVLGEGGGAPSSNGDAALLQPALDNLLRGCDLLDSSACLYPFPNNAFTVPASIGSPQAAANGGTGLRVNFSLAATPRNSVGKPVDPEDWNRNDGFSPGALITTYVPALSLEKTYGLPLEQIGVANLALSQQADAPVLLLEVPQAPELNAPRRQLAWAEIDSNANVLLPNAAPLAGELPFDPISRPAADGRAALLIRPGKNLGEGRRYVVVLRGLKNAAGDALAAQAGFAACRSRTPSALPPVQARCAALERDVFPVLDAAGIARDDSLYLAWDFTVASTNGTIGRLRHMRDDAFASLAKTSGADCSTAREDGACNTPSFTIDKVTTAPQTGIARRIEGTLTVPSYLVPADAAPLEDPRLSAALDAFCAGLPASAPQQLREGCADFRDVAGIGQGIATPPNRLNYTPATSDPCAGLSPQQIPGSNCVNQARYGDGLPDRNGSMSTRFICQIPARATPDAPARAGIYGHGLLDSRQAVTYDGVPDMSREHNYLFCAVDFYGFATGDLLNVAGALLDVSSFGVIPDASQQGIVNFAFLARLLRDANGFAANPAFQQDGRPLFDRSAVFYDGNSQGGILGGVVLAASKDVQRGALGSLGMNYSTLLTRSTDFDEYALPLYAAYTDPLDRQLVFSMIQMLWDRSENNGYAAHLTDNSAFGGEPKIVKLDPQFGDHQVTMWSADVMARTMGIPVSASHTARVAAKLGQIKRHPDVVPYLGLVPLDYNNPAQTAGGALHVWDDERTLIPPLGNNPPREGRDPHDDSAKKVSGRCQKAHFLRTGGQLVDVTAVEFDGAACPAVPPVNALRDADGDGVADASDRCAATPAGATVDANGCSAEQAAADDDGDGVSNVNDSCPNTAAGDPANASGCGAAQRDSDGDGVNDASDLCPGTPAGSPVSASGCPVTTSASCDSGQNLDGNRSYQVTIPSESGEQISFQVLEPKTFNCTRRAQGAHPLILHGHGFGGSRSTTGFANYRELGYTVISVDLRGFGGSSGTVRVMDPDFEGKDLIRILDWAEQNLDYLAWRNEGSVMKPFVARPATGVSVAGGSNLLVGSIGSSYGGGYQLLLQNVDPKNRLDAMAPDITWHDLRWSLNPGDVIKTGWDLLLVAGGEAGSYPPGLQNQESPTQRGLDPYIVETLARGVATAELPRESLEWFRYHSPSYWCGLNGQPTMPYGVNEPAPFDPNFMLTGFINELPGSNARTGQPGIPTLLSQGMRDTLFNFNDAWWNYQCMATRGDDVRLITHQSGHILTNVPVPALNFGNSGGNNDCGNRKRGDATVQWFNEKLMGSGTASILAGTENALCVSLADGDAVDIPVDKFLAPHDAAFQPALTASWTEFSDLGTSGLPQGLAAQQLHLAGQDRPGIVPLLTVSGTQGLILGGIAQAEITVSTPQMANDLACAEAQLPTLRTGCDSIIFVGLGLKVAGGSSYVLIDDQVLPVRGVGSHQALSLVGVGERLKTGDSLALMVYGYSPQYPLSFSRDATIPVVNVSGSLQLPLYAVAAGGQPDFTVTAESQLQRAGGTPVASGSSTPLCAPLLGCVNDLPVVGEPLQALIDTLANASGLAGAGIDTQLIAQAAEATLRGCDMLDPAHCLYPFPSDHFTVAAAAGSIQSAARGGSGRRIHFNPLAMPRNVFGKPIDPTEWNRNDGYSPGAMLITYVPGLATVKSQAGQPTGPVQGAVPLTDLRRYADADAPILVIDADTGERHPIWAEIDLNAGLLLPAVADQASPLPKRPALIVRAAKNFTEGHRYIAVLRQLRNEAGEVIPAQHPFQVCRDGDDTYSQLPQIAARCATLEQKVFSVLARPEVGIARDESLYLAWDFTIASANNDVARLRHMRDDAFQNVLGEPANAPNPGEPGYPAGRAPEFSVTEVTENPDGPTGKTVRRIRGVLKTPSYVIPADPAPLDEQSDLQAQLQQLAEQCNQITQGNCGVPGVAGAGDGAELATSASLPPNRLFYNTTDNSAPVPDASNSEDPTGLRYGDGMPDRNPTGDLATNFTCNIPRSAVSGDASMQDALPADVRPVRPTLYGHGLLGGHGEGNGQASDFGNRYGLMTCAMDWFGFAAGDIPNVATVLVDLSNFPVVPDGSQQGMLNQMFLARLAVHPDGFAAHPAFQVQGRPVFDRREVFYHGNSQGGILGGVLVAASKDINRGVLGVLGMNYSTLLSRSTDFATYSIPLYLAYPNDLDRPLNFALMQMLWDRSENNGYAAHLSDNTALGGPANQVLLHPAFGDHQVSMWTADVMARTVGARVDAQRVSAARSPEVDGAEYALIEALDFRNPAHAAGSALVPYDEEWLSANPQERGRCEGNSTPPPPIGNVPPGNVGDDPHECPRRDPQARCQASNFLQRTVAVAAGDSVGRLIDPAAVSRSLDTADGSGCPAVSSSGAPTTGGSYTPPATGAADGLLAILGRLSDTLDAFLTALMAGDVQTAIAILQGGGNQLAGSALTQVATTAGDAAGLTLAPPAPDAAPALPAPQPLLAGIAKGAVHIPVGTPLGGYLRPPVGGEYLPGLEAFAGGDPSKFFAELVDFLPTAQDHDGLPLLALPDELRKLHSPYATYSPPSRGYYDSLVAKAVALYDGNDYVVLVKTDFIGMLDELVQGVADKVQAETISPAHPDGIDLHNGLIMSASHTHDGPGAVGNHSIRYFWLAIDAYQPEVYQRAVDDLAQIVKRAVLNMQPAKIGHAMGQEGFDHPVKGRTELNGYRRSLLPSYSQAANDEVRRRLGLLRIDRADGTPLALVMNFAVHGIAFDVENQYFSGDVPASLERATEQRLNLPLVMMVQNTGGNISPRGVDNDNKLQRIESFGELFAPEVQAIYQGIGRFQTAPDLRTVSQRIILNRERLGYQDGEFPYQWGGAQCNNDIEAPFVGGGPGDIPGYNQTGLPRKATQCIPATPPDAIDLADNGVGENGAFVPQDTRLTAAKIGDITLLAQPGEPLTEYGVRLLDLAGDEGYARDDTFIWGYSQDHVGYILAPEKADWDMGGTEGTTTFWGWKQGQRFLDVNRELLIALRDGKAAPADEFQVNYFYQQYYAQQPGAPVLPSPRPGRVVTEPADIARFAATSFAWEGGDPVIDSPAVLLEQEVNGSWQAARRANGEAIDSLFEMHLRYRLQTGAHVWALDFEAPKDWPLGRYRFSVSGIARQAANAPYSLSSQPFSVTPSDSLLLSAPVAANGRVEVTLAYTPRPDNYRVIDALVPGDRAAPVRQGRVLFSNGQRLFEDRLPKIEVRDGRLVAVYSAVLDGAVTATGSDVYGNTTAGDSGPPVADAGGNRGSGILGAVAEFFASVNQAIAALANGDPAAAGEQLQAALATLGEDLAAALVSGETGLVAVLTHLGDNLADGDPEAAAEQANADLGAFAGLDTDLVSAVQRSASAARHVEAVVMTGAQLPGWSAPAAEGAPYPYPSGATITGAVFDPTPIPGQVRNAHNGVFFHPAGWQPGDAPVAGIGAAVAEIAAYAYSASGWREIPVQVDERYPFFLANAGSDFSVYSGTDEELTYAWDRETWNPADSPDGCSAVPPAGVPDPVAGIDDDDELVFMAADAGEQAPQGALPPDVPADSAGQLVTLADPLAREPGTLPPRFVYLFRKPGGSAFAGRQRYVNYSRDANANQWIDRSFFADDDPEKIGTSNTGYGANLSGTVCHPSAGRKNSSDRFPRDGVSVSTDTYLWKATGRWMVREISIRKPAQPGVYGADLIDRWKGRAFQQSPDSTISLVGFEDEQVNWEANSALLGERCGPVRCMREVWGADSGTNVTKTETFYRDAVISRYHVRVHPIPPDGLYTSWDYNRGAMLPTAAEKAAGVQAGRYYTALRPQGVPIDGVNDDLGQIDSVAPIGGQCLTSDGPRPAENGRCPAFLDAADASFNLPLAFDNWEQVAAKGDLGSMVYTFELKGATSLATPLVVPYYRDDACLDDGTGDDPVQRPYPGEASTDARVIAGYTDRNRDGQVSCDEKQGAYAAHGIHYFATGDVDNAFLFGKPINEIDGQQWQFMVPTAAPTNVGEPYANVARFPLRVVATPLP